MLQGKDEAAACIVIAHRCAGAIVRRGVRRAGAAEAALAEIEGEGIAAALAPRSAEKGDAAPAAWAERAHRPDRDSADKAARRQNDVEKAGPEAPQAQRGGGVQHGIILI